MKTTRNIIAGLALCALGLASAQAQQLASDLTVTRTVKLTGVVTPAEITADQNNYAPSSVATAIALRLSSDATRTITGLDPGTAASGRDLRIFNVGSNAIIFAAESASSTAANRFALPSSFTLMPGRSVIMNYDGASSRWRMIGGAADIPDDAVTFAKMQNIASDRLIGRDTAGSGDPEEISVGGGIEFTGAGALQLSAFTGDVTKSAGGTGLTIANDAVTFAKLQNVDALSVVGNATNSAADADEITAGTDHQVLRRSGTSIGFGALNLAQSAAVTGILPSTNGGTGNGFTKFSGPTTSEKTFTLPNASANILTDAATVTVAQGGTGATTLTGVVKGNGTSAMTAAVAGTDYVAPGAVTTSGLTMATSRVLGRTSASTGAIEELTAANLMAFLGIQGGSATLSAADETKSITFSTAYASAPTSVTVTIETPTSGYVITANVRDITTTGFTAVFGAAVPATGYKLHWKAQP
jgi:hypothetical protein